MGFQGKVQELEPKSSEHQGQDDSGEDSQGWKLDVSDSAIANGATF